jgi:hypothetical protein
MGLVFMTGKYLLRRRFYVPKDECCRDYGRKDFGVSDYGVDWGVIDDDY